MLRVERTGAVPVAGHAACLAAQAPLLARLDRTLHDAYPERPVGARPGGARRPRGQYGEGRAGCAGPDPTCAPPAPGADGDQRGEGRQCEARPAGPGPREHGGPRAVQARQPELDPGVSAEGPQAKCLCSHPAPGDRERSPGRGCEGTPQGAGHGGEGRCRSAHQGEYREPQHLVQPAGAGRERGETEQPPQPQCTPPRDEGAREPQHGQRRAGEPGTRRGECHPVQRACDQDESGGGHTSSTSTRRRTRRSTSPSGLVCATKVSPGAHSPEARSITPSCSAHLIASRSGPAQIAPRIGSRITVTYAGATSATASASCSHAAAARCAPGGPSVTAVADFFGQSPRVGRGVLSGDQSDPSGEGPRLFVQPGPGGAEAKPCALPVHLVLLHLQGGPSYQVTKVWRSPARTGVTRCGT